MACWFVEQSERERIATARWREPNPPVPKYFWAGVWFSNHPLKRRLEGPNISSKSVWKLLEDYGNERMLFVIYICLKLPKLGSMFSLNDLSMHTVKLPTLSWDMLCISQRNHSQVSDGCWNLLFTCWMLEHVEVWIFLGDENPVRNLNMNPNKIGVLRGVVIPVIRNIPYLRYPILPKNFWGSQLPPPLEHPPPKYPVTTEKRSALFQGGFHSTGKILQLDTSLDPLLETYRRVYPQKN